MNAEDLLSDEFLRLSAKIAEIHEEKKRKKAELRAIYERFQDDFHEMDERAAAALREFETWRESQCGE